MFSQVPHIIGPPSLGPFLDSIVRWELLREGKHRAFFGREIVANERLDEGLLRILAEQPKHDLVRLGNEARTDFESAIVEGVGLLLGSRIQSTAEAMHLDVV